MTTTPKHSMSTSLMHIVLQTGWYCVLKAFCIMTPGHDDKSKALWCTMTTSLLHVVVQTGL